VFLVGVGGSVPDYDDGSKHVRLGDIVVSVPTGIGKYQYLQCQKLEYLHVEIPPFQMITTFSNLEFNNQEGSFFRSLGKY
jgi:hypothetical protein